MLTHNQYKRLATSEISTRRQKAFTRQEQHRVRLFKKFPELVRLDAQQRELAQRVAEEVGAQGEMGQRTARHVASAQKMLNERMLALGVSENSLLPNFSCSICSDLGRHNGQICRCTKDLINSYMQKDLAQITPLTLSTFGTFDIFLYPENNISELEKTAREHMREVLSYCREFAGHFVPDNRSLLMIGDAGLGKTHLALAIANEVIGKGNLVVYVSAGNIFEELEQERRKGDGNLFEMLCGADLLILDDLGCEIITKNSINYLYNLINTRMNASRCSVYTTNIKTQDMLIARYTEKIASRLLGSCDQLHFVGEDIRLLQGL